MARLRFPDPPLAGEVVFLRPWARADVPALIRAFNDPVMRRFSWRVAPFGAADARARLAWHERARGRGEALDLALVEPGDHAAVLGGVTLHEIRADLGRAAVGYWLDPGGRGRGAATEGVRLLARWAFAALPIGRLELTCGPDNVASQRVAERCGFTREGLLRSYVPFQDGRRDSLIYSLLPDDL